VCGYTIKSEPIFKRILYCSTDTELRRRFIHSFRIGIKQKRYLLEIPKCYGFMHNGVNLNYNIILKSVL